MYWMHRFQHNNKYLWRTHEAHHSVREVDFLAGSRSHFSEILINQTIEFAPIFFLLDIESAMYMYPAKALLDAVWGMWTHANVNVNTGLVYNPSSNKLSSSIFSTPNWEVFEESGKLLFSQDGVKKMRLDSSGNLAITGTLTESATL